MYSKRKVFSILFFKLYLSQFPSILKYANITFVFKKCLRGSRENYYPVSILSVISKIFGKNNYDLRPIVIDTQMWIQERFQSSKLPTRNVGTTSNFGKDKSSVDKGKVFNVLLTDISKAFVCLPHELNFANYLWFQSISTNFMYNDLVEQKQSTKINQAYSSWEVILYGVPK